MAKAKKRKSKIDRETDRALEVFRPGLDLLIAEKLDLMTIFYCIVYNTVRSVVPVKGDDHDRINAAIWEMVDKLIGTDGRKAMSKRKRNTNRKESQAQ